MKRKDFDHVYDEFCDFSLSSPARKIRRLDAELPPIMEEVDEEGPEIPAGPSVGSNAGFVGNSGSITQQLQSVPENEERAIVLFKPMNAPLVHSPSTFSVKVNPQFINGFKSQVLWGRQANVFKPADDVARTQENSCSSKECLAVVPWVPSQLPSAHGAEDVGQIDISDMMDAEDIEGITMDVEDTIVTAELRTVVDSGGVAVNEGLQQWQQQHCIYPQMPQNTTTPIVWYR